MELTRVGRLHFVDAVRGAAIAGVVLFHLVWDLEFTGFISGFAFHPAWLAFGKLLAGTFMYLVGFSLVLAHGKRFRSTAFWKRLAVIAVSALAITVITYAVFPEAFVYYGILHAITVASVICAPFLRFPVGVTVAMAAAFLILPAYLSSETFDPRWLAWTGFASSPPVSNDFVPVFPWAGLSLFGVASGKLFETLKERSERFSKSASRAGPSWLTWLGRHSLVIYLLHQPVLLAVIVPLSLLL